MAFAQENQPGDEQAKLERLKALYVAYVTKQLDLTPDEAQRFWPVHTQFENDLKNVNKDLPELEKEQARLNIKKKYQDGFVKIIGTQRFEKFMRLNQEFREKLRKQIQNTHQRQRPIRRGQ